MSNLPFIQPDRELYYNLGVLLLIVNKLALTKTKKPVLTFDRMQSYYFLVTKPNFLNKVLRLAGKNQVHVSDSDFYTVENLAINVDELFDRERLIALVKLLANRNQISATYSAKDGFVFQLTECGTEIAGKLTEGQFKKIDHYAEQLAQMQSQSPSKLSGFINQVIKREV